MTFVTWFINLFEGMIRFLKVMVNNYRKFDFIVFTISAILAQSTTVFYIIYFFWWNELTRIIIDKLFYKRNPNIIRSELASAPLLGTFFQMGIYLVFIVVFFGVIANWGNQEMTAVNFEILFFKNWFFNSNLLFVILERIFLHINHSSLRVSFGHFTPNMIVLHFSIILGGILMFFLIKNHPETFTADNLWGSIIIILPFVLLRRVIEYLSKPFNENVHI